MPEDAAPGPADRPADRPDGSGHPGVEGTAGAAGLAELLRERADPRTNSVVMVVLRVGLAVALVLLAVGLVVQMASGRHEAVQVHMFRLLEPASLGERIMGVGVLVLALTPAAAVLTLMVRWAVERDLRFVAVGVLVVVVLGAAVAVGFVGS